MSANLIVRLASDISFGCDVIICEASMGLFDGVPGPIGQTGSSADVAAALGWPVVLVLDVSGQSQSAAAIVKGCATYDPRITIAGVVLNRVASPRHTYLATQAIEALGIPVVGAMPRSESIALPERHLGLVQARETSDLDFRLERIADFVAEHTNISVIQSLALRSRAEADDTSSAIPPPGQRIAVAHDAAFSFLYPHLLRSWRGAGADILFFSPLANEAPDKDCDACWLPGGYPELHAGRIASSYHFFNRLRDFAKTRPIHGECGGYMTLGTSMMDAQGIIHTMAGLLDVSTSFAQPKLHLGYRNACLIADGCLGKSGTRLHGHEFHYASVDRLGDDESFALVSDAYGTRALPTGSRRGRVSGSFFHVIAVAL
jgi:cobyrinic acid a,c-diamide synthase